MSGFDNDIMYSTNADFSTAGAGGASESNGLISNGQLWIGRTAVNAGGTHIDVNTLTAGSGISITNGPGTITVTNTGPANDYHSARYIVSAGGAADGANYTTISSAITAAAAAVAPQTIFIQPGIYTENLTLSPGINLCAFDCDAYTPNVTILGKMTVTATGSYAISGINLKTNGDYVLQMTGANATTVYLINCFITATNANAINCTNANAGLQLYRCNGNCGTNTYFIYTAGAVNVYYSILSSTNSTTASTFASANVSFSSSAMYCPVTTSGTGSFSSEHTFFNVLNATTLTIGGSGSSFLYFSRIEGGTGSAISIGTGATLPVISCSVFSTNTNAITGLGTLQYALIAFYGAGASSTVNTTTKTPLATLL